MSVAAEEDYGRGHILPHCKFTYSPTNGQTSANFKVGEQVDYLALRSMAARRTAKLQTRACKLQQRALCLHKVCVPLKKWFYRLAQKNVPRLTAWNVSYVCWCVWLRPVLLQQLPRQLQEPLRPLPSLLRLRPRWQRLRELHRQPSCCGGCDA